ncbi:alpha/beta hydrolase [Peloplasma aerotolerans]|uniref:Alpha/beta hydrolase n=1 Tax=Peloplasma aerotolerans TaxID=3044389 RepID=A0AAW6U9S5_9MOLU|nr:alpha/beta hydrolase [Mariniplasma sp. M4Ah]MDI6453640.1 alpha/beta hydrolase [Mariniplasma sp. M4Ah]MDR4969355.1 alpha/beta hydrolase [Acholeplasmataceae bacterium]
MNHIYQKGKNDITLLLLHGTGGNEYDLLPLAKHIDQEASYLGVRGNILENGMSRFFKRISMGVFDEISLKEESMNLYDFIDKASIKYDFDRNKIVVIGYSNGANIAANLMLTYTNPFNRAILFHPMVPSRNKLNNKLNQMNIFISSGKNDAMVPQNEVFELTEMFESLEANVDVYWTDAGHQLTHEEITKATEWYHQNKST